MTTNPSTNLLRAVLLGAGVLWGLTIAVSPLQIESGWDPLPLIFWQALVSTVLLSLWMVAQRRSFPLDRRTLVFYVIMALTGTAAPQVLSLAASDQIAVAVRSIMFALIPMISLGFGLLFRIETVSGRRLLGLLLGFVAIGIIALFGSDNAGFGGKELSFLWFGAMLLVVALYAFENNWVKLMMPGDMNPFVALLGANLFSVFLLIPVMLAQTDTWIGLPLAFDGIHARPTFMFWLVTAIQIIAYGGFVFCIDKGGPAFAGQVSYIVTASGVLWGLIIFQQERLTPAIVIALIVVLGGIALVNPNRQGAADKTKAAIGSTADETAINR